MMRTLFTALLLCSSLTQAQSYRLEGIERVVAIADIHGAYDAFVSLLQGTALVDNTLRWTGQQTHLVIVGDVLDRGAASKQVMDLLRRLEDEAVAAGGAVHMVLGNHEVMNLSGELAYVTREEFSAYDDFEPKGMRRKAQSRFEKTAPGLSALALRTAFSRQYPRGFFGHRAAFAPDGVYGSWLLNKPQVLVINDTAFVHAGFASRLLTTDLDTLNTTATTTLRTYLAAVQVLIAEDILFPETDFNNHAGLARRYLEGKRAAANADVIAAAETVVALSESDPFAVDSPVWYRGMVDCSPALEQGRVQQLLATLQVSRLVIGHTPTRDRLVQERFDTTLLLADTGMLNDYFGGQPAALIFEGGNLSVYYPQNAGLTTAVPMPRLLGARPVNVGDDELQALLTQAIWLNSTTGNNGELVASMQLKNSDTAFKAVYRPPLNGADGSVFLPEVAAYRLDRLLGMDMFPVAVVTTNGEPGQTGGALLIQDEGQTVATPGAEPWCPVEDQLAQMQVFDFLLNKQNRREAELRYMSGNGKLVLPLERELFSTAPPAALPENARSLLSRSLRDRLTALTPAVLEQELGSVLDTERRAALLARRDLLLNLP